MCRIRLRFPFFGLGIFSPMDILVERGRISLRLFFSCHFAACCASCGSSCGYQHYGAVINMFWIVPERFLRELLVGAWTYSSNHDHRNASIRFVNQSRPLGCVYQLLFFSYFRWTSPHFLHLLWTCFWTCFSLPVSKFPARLPLHSTSSNYSRSHSSSVTSSM